MKMQLKDRSILCRRLEKTYRYVCKTSESRRWLVAELVHQGVSSLVIKQFEEPSLFDKHIYFVDVPCKDVDQNT